MLPAVVLESVSKLLLLLHAAAAVVTIGAVTHHAWTLIRQARGGATEARKQRRFVTLLLWSYLATFVLGVLVYPAFRVYVRAAHFDSELPLATGFFEIKEHWLALGLALLFVQVPLSRRLAAGLGKLEARLFLVNGLLLSAVVWLAMVTGFALTALRPV